MILRKLTQKDLESFREYLTKEEKSTATIEKYLRDVRAFFLYAGELPITKELNIEYKKYLLERGYALRSINSMISSINSYFRFLGWTECRVKIMRQQRLIYSNEENVLTKEEYIRLLMAAKEKERLYLLLQTICATGIRISELRYFTVEALERGDVVVHCKNKTRIVLIPSRLMAMLLQYAKRNHIQNGPIFVTRSGKPLERENIWKEMKSLCDRADVNPQKVFPHNLRKLFARTFYSQEKDIAKLADILGHGNIETTRIYLMSTEMEHREKIEKLGLLFQE